MQLLVEAFNLKHAQECIKNNVPNLILGNEIFASRISYSFNESEIASLVNDKKQTKIWIKVNAFFFEHELNRLFSYLKWLSTIKIDYVIFQDFAVAQINDEEKFGLNLHYNPETIVTSYGQFPFYCECGFDSVFIAREIIWKELEQICENKSSLKVAVQGHGYGFIMHSRWNLISNFEKYYDVKIQGSERHLLIREKLRKYPNLVFEDRHGTHMLTGYLIYTIDILKKLNEIGVDFLQLHFLQTSEQYAIDVTNLYTKVMQKEIEPSVAKKDLEKISKEYVLSHGFFGNVKDVLHTIKNEGDNE